MKGTSKTLMTPHAQHPKLLISSLQQGMTIAKTRSGSVIGGRQNKERKENMVNLHFESAVMVMGKSHTSQDAWE
jgi:hypothetical protein